MTRCDPEQILELLEQSDVGLTAGEFIRQIASRLSVSLGEARKIVRHLVKEQELCYLYKYGATYIEKNFLRPVQVSPHYILKPPEFQLSNSGNCRRIIIRQGISFGDGRHPTTRLCLEALDDIFFKDRRMDDMARFSCADIGSGSGILAIAMMISGLSSCLAFEIDPVSVSEARRNIMINHLERRITLMEDYFSPSPRAYAMICANLRYPTLVDMAGDISRSLIKGGVAVLSGVRIWETKEVIKNFHQKGMMTIWRKDEKNWSGLALIKA
jgi:ribosomal protein L11 methyltransferase